MLTWLTSPSWWHFVLYSAIAIVALGALFTCAFGVAKGMLRLFGLTSWLLSWCWHRLTGKAPDSHGSAHLADAPEIASKGLFTEGGIMLATWQGKTLYEPSGGHVAIMAPPRSWKSTSFLAPNIAKFAGSILVNDPRGELWSTCHVDREAKGSTYRFNPTGKDSCGIDITEAIRWGQDEQHGDVQRLSHGLLSPDPGESWDDFSLQASALLAPILTHGHDRGHGSLPGIYQWLTDPATTMKEQAAEMSASAIPQVQAGGRRLRDLLTSERTASIVWSRLISALDLYSDPLVSANCDHSDLDLRDLQHAPRPVSLFFTPSFSDVPRLRPLLGALTEQLCALFSAQQEQPRQTVAMFLDETGNLGRLSELERGMSYLQGSGVQIIQTWQNVLQCRQVYGKDSPILASVATTVYYTPSDQETAEHISEQLGDTTARLRPETQTVSWWGLLQRTSYGTTEHARPLLTPDEVRRLHETAAVIIHKGLAPIRGTKLGSATPEVIDLAKPWIKRVAAFAGVFLLTVGVTSWALWPKAKPTPKLSLTTTHEGGGTDAKAEGMPPSLSTEPDYLDAVTRLSLKPYDPKPWVLHRDAPNMMDFATVGHQTFATEAACQVALHELMGGRITERRNMAADPRTAMRLTVTDKPSFVKIVHQDTYKAFAGGKGPTYTEMGFCYMPLPSDDPPTGTPMWQQVSKPMTYVPMSQR